MSFKSEIDAESKKLIKRGVSPLEALKQAVQVVSERKMSEIAQSDEAEEVMPKQKEKQKI